MKSIELGEVLNADDLVKTLGKEGITTLAELKLAGVALVAGRPGIQGQRLYQLLGQAELRAYGVPAEIADVLVQSGVVHRAGEIPALEAEQLRDILRREVQAGNLAAETDLSIEAIEAWRAKVPRMTLDEESTAVMTAEASSDGSVDEESAGGVAELDALAPDTLRAVIQDLQSAAKQAETQLATLQKAGKGWLQPEVFEPIAATLTKQVASAITRRPATGFTVLDEDESVAMASEDESVEERVGQLQTQLRDVQLEIETLRARAISGAELSTEAVSDQAGPILPRGEEVDDG